MSLKVIGNGTFDRSHTIASSSIVTGHILYHFRKMKRSFYRAANAIFGKTGRFASEEVTLHLLKIKCRPYSCSLIWTLGSPIK